MDGRLPEVLWERVFVVDTKEVRRVTDTWESEVSTILYFVL